MSKQQRSQRHEGVESQERKQDANRSRRHRENLLNVMLMCGKIVRSTAGSVSYAAD